MRLIPIGGLGEFGANSLLLSSTSDERVLLDAGAAFSDRELFGVAYEVPDFAALSVPPAALLLTHGHDDHFKGVTHLASAFPEVPAYGSPATVARLRVAGDADAALLPPAHTFPNVSMLSGEGWEVEPLAVSHSIPGTVMLRLQIDGVRVVTATDVRLAPSALGEVTPRETLRSWGQDGVEVALLDSTNALVTTPPPSEAEVAATLAELVAGARGAVVGVTFASHAGRFLQFAQAAVAAGRVVVPLGRGLDEMLAVQMAIGGFAVPPGTVRAARELPCLPRERLVLVTTGSQGESGAAFTRLAADNIPGFRLQPGDLVIHAARTIPGHERRLAALLDHCVRRGAAVVTAEQAPVHASGHPHRGELDELLEALRPRWVVPVHGRRRHLEAAAALARRHGCSTVVVENGQPLEWRNGELRPLANLLAIGRVLVSDGGTTVDPGVLRERRVLARSGVVSVVIPRGQASGNGFGEPELSFVGLALAERERRYLVTGLRAELRRATAQRCGGEDDLRSTMTRWLRGELRRRHSCRPAVLVAFVG